jgi:hypothetical protein
MYCIHCDKHFLSKNAVKYHYDHNVCIKNQVKCCLCGREFTSNAALIYHTEHNVCKKEKVETVPPPKETKKIVIKLKSDISTYTKEELLVKVSQLEKVIDTLETKYQTLKDNPQTVNNVNIIVAPALSMTDNYNQITHDQPKLLHTALTKHPANFISYMIQQTTCNPECPIYNSVKITNRKDNLAQISDGTKYLYITKKKIIDQLIENKRSILREYIDNNGDKYGERILKRYQDYVDALDDDKKLQKDLENDIICMLLDVSEIIGREEWSKKLLSDLNDWKRAEVNPIQ